jgi:hypothetical protein
MGAVAVVLYRLRCRLRSGWRATAVLAATVAVTGGMVLTLAAGAVRTLTASDRYADSRGTPFDATLEQQGGGPRTEEVAALPAVAAISSATFVFGSIVPEGSGLDLEDPSAATGVVFAGSQVAFGTVVVDGREPDPSDPTEFAVSQPFVDATGASIGDRWDLYVVPSEIARQRGFDAGEEDVVRLLTGTLVGVVDGPAQLQDGLPLAVFPRSLLDTGDIGVSATISAVSLSPGATLADLRTQLDGLPEGSEFGLDPAEWVPRVVRDAVRVQGLGLAVLAAIAATATVVVTGQLLSRQVRLSEADRAILGAMGMGRVQRVADPLLFAAVPAVAGVAAGVLGAYLASDAFPTGFAAQVEPHPGLRFETLPLVVGAAALLVLVLAWVAVALVGARRTSGRPRRRTVVDAIARRVPLPAATALRLGFVRQVRDPNGPRSAVAGMVAVLLLLVGALTFGASLEALVHTPARWGDDFDLSVGQGGAEELPEGALEHLRADPDVAGLTLYGTILTTVGTDGFDISGLQSILGSSAPHVFDGRLPDGRDEIALGRVAARRFGVGIGDDLEVLAPAGRRVLHITGTALIPGVEGGDGIGEGGVMTFEGLQDLDPEAAPTGAGIVLREGASAAAVQDRLRAATGLQAGLLDRPGVIVNLARVQSIPYVVAAILGGLALLNLGHQLILSTHRRRRDVAVLRALGAGGRWVTSVVHWQASLFTVLVMALSVPLGIVVGRIVYRALADRIGALDTVTLPFGYFAVAAAGLVALANVVAVPTAVRARRGTPSALLADE